MHAKVLVLLGSFALSFFSLEAALRVSGRIRRPPDRIVSSRPELYEEYRPYGYRLRPSRVTTYTYPLAAPRQLTVTSNRHGFRSRREFDEPDGRLRIAVLGDSMVFGDGVEEPERFTEQLETEEPAWRVDNLGMTGFGPDLMLRAFEQVGMALSPRIVVLTIYTDDFRRVRPEYAGAGFPIPRFRLRDGRLEDVPYPHFSPWSRLSTVSLVREVVWRSTDIEWRLNEAILDRLREHASQAKFSLAVLFLPGTTDTPKDRSRREWLQAYTERHHTAYLDLTPSILTPAARELFIPNNWHLNPRGHHVVARALRPFLDALLRNGDLRTTNR